MSRLINAFEQFFDGAGDPLVSGKLWFYVSGSSTIAKDTFADNDETILNTNPVPLGGDGRAPNIFGSGVYRVILTGNDDVQILQRDPIGGDSGVSFGADWVSTQTYGTNDVTRDAGEYWISLISGNQNIRPSTDGGANWIRWPNDILNATILGGTIDNTIIGGTTPAAGSFTTADIDGGTIDGTTIGATTPSTGDFTTLTATTPCLPDGYISGLIGSQAADTDHDITISTGAARDSTGAYDLRLTSAITKQIDVAWAAGDAAGGLDTGTFTTTTEYWYFLIRKDSDASIDVLISASRTAPSMPAGYTYRSNPIHWVISDGAPAIVNHRAILDSGGGIYYEFKDFIAESSSTIGTTSAPITLTTPGGINVEAHVGLGTAAANTGSVRVSSTYVTDTALGATYITSPTQTNTGSANREDFYVLTDTSSQVRILGSAASQAYALFLLGFKWGRK